jgi:hypothetical protein
MEHENPQTSMERKTWMSMTLTTFSTDAQRRQDLESLKKELKLRGYKVTIHVVNYT